MIGVTAITDPWKGVTANSQNDTEAERKQLLLIAWQDNVVTQTLQPLLVQSRYHRNSEE